MAREFIFKSKRNKGERKGIDVLLEIRTKSEVRERRGKMFYWSGESFAKKEMSEGRRKIIDRV